MNSELQMPVGIVVMYMDHNGFYCIKENLSWLTPGTSHPGRLPLSPSFKFEVDDISVHFGILTAQVPQRLGCVPSVLVCNCANSVDHGYALRPIFRFPKLFHFPAK